MNIFDIILSPFIFLIKEIFLISYKLTGNYGLSIILLSFGISLILLPIFVLIEKVKKKNDAIKLKMKPLVDEIKRCYKGQERYYYLRTLNRQHNFNPLKALFPILSLLLQIPFFIAAYQFLENYEPLKGISFLFIKDLSAPDHLFGNVHFLPVLMTIINLITAYFYTRNGNTSERRQMVVVATIFLILLFNLPSGLVLYWTMNNFFSFVRLFITNPEVFKKIDKSKAVDIYGVINCLPDGNTIKSIVISVFSNSYVFFGILFISIYLFLSATFFYEETNLNLSIFSMIIGFCAQTWAVIAFRKTKLNISKAVLNLVSTVLIILFVYQLISLVSILFKLTSIYSLISFPFRQLWLNIAFIGIIFNLLLIPIYLKKKKLQVPESNGRNFIIYLLSIIYIVGLILFWNPLLVYSSFPEAFSFPAKMILLNKLPIFLLIISSSVLIFIFLPKKLKFILTIVVTTLLVSSFVHSTILPIKLGTLQMGKYIQAQRLAQPLIYFILDGLFLYLTYFFIKRLLQKNYRKVIIYSILTISIILIGQSIFKSINTGVFFDKSNLEPNKAEDIVFSKDKENVVFVIADMFMGWFLNDILKEEPNLKNDLEGFVWYPNTVSVSSITSSSICPILEGYDYTVDKLNKDNKHTVSEKVSASTERFFKKVKSKGFDFECNKMVYSKIDKNEFDSFIPEWNVKWDKWNDTLNINVGQTKDFDLEILWENALLYASPLFLKSSIYNQGKWINSNVGENENSKVAKLYNFMRILPFISNADGKSKNFIYYHTRATHIPWNYVNDRGELIEDVPSYENQKWFLKTFAKWIKWMKENDVYDNTKIILLSDHSHFLGEQRAKEFGGKFKWNEKGQQKISAEHFWRLNALLLVKDFNSKGRLSEDWRLMCNADVPAMLFNENDPTKGTPIANRKIPVTYVNWVSEIDQNTTVEILHHFWVSDTVYFPKNWKKYSE